MSEKLDSSNSRSGGAITVSLGTKDIDPNISIEKIRDLDFSLSILEKNKTVPTKKSAENVSELTAKEIMRLGFQGAGDCNLAEYRRREREG